jgi:hypothetical protein
MAQRCKESCRWHDVQSLLCIHEKVAWVHALASPCLSVLYELNLVLGSFIANTFQFWLKLENSSGHFIWRWKCLSTHITHTQHTYNTRTHTHTHTQSSLNHSEKCSGEKLYIKINLKFCDQQSYSFWDNERKWIWYCLQAIQSNCDRNIMLYRHLLSSLNGFHLDMKVTKSDSAFSISVVLSELMKIFSCLRRFCACNHHQLMFFSCEEEWLCAFIFHTFVSVLHKFSVFYLSVA